MRPRASHFKRIPHQEATTSKPYFLFLERNGHSQEKSRKFSFRKVLCQQGTHQLVQLLSPLVYTGLVQKSAQAIVGSQSLPTSLKEFHSHKSNYKILYKLFLARHLFRIVSLINRKSNKLSCFTGRVRAKFDKSFGPCLVPKCAAYK